MSDNIPKDLREHRMNANLRLPSTEVWTDIFKLLSRRTLVQRIQPVNHWFKEICDKNVKSVHVIGDLGDFMWKLGHKYWLAVRQLKALEGHDCALVDIFRITNVRIHHNGKNEAKLAILHDLMDLFRRCQLIISPQSHMFNSPDELAEHCQAYLTLFEPVKPSYIEMCLDKNLKEFEEFLQTHLSGFLRHPTMLNCARLKLSGKTRAWDNRQAIFDWLHHQSDMEVEEQGENMRCLNLDSYYNYNSQDRPFAEWLLERCIQNFNQAKVPEDRRCFLFSFYHYNNVLQNFSRKTPATGEVLQLEALLFQGHPKHSYRLLRCSAHLMTNGNCKEQLYAKLFEPDYDFDFKLERARDVIKVEIF